jgi:phosphoribosylanthranilate isomerase
VSRGCVVPAEIKYCGLTRREDAEYAAALGASFVGVIFAGGPRNLTVQKASDVLAAVPRDVQRVGVFADQTPDDIARSADQLQLDVVQLHGGARAARIEALRASFDGKIWLVCRVGAPPLPADVAELAGLGDGLVLDSYVRGTLGGTGVTMAWSALSQDVDRIRRDVRLFVLAGGLRPENVARAIATLTPHVVDVSSGVESAPGIKDHDRMRAFRDVVAALDSK